MQARTRVGIGVGSSLALREATNHSEKAQGTQVYGCGVEIGQQAGLDKGRALLQKMVVSYLVLLEGLEESRGSKSQLVLPRDCRSVSGSRGSMVERRTLLRD